MSTERIRTTISLPADVHEVFKRMAEAGGMSVSRCMGDWLTDTADGAQFVIQKMEEARRAPKTVMRELQAYSRSMVKEVDTLFDELRKGEPAAGGGLRSDRPAAPARRKDAPSSNTGLKSPKKTTRRG